MTFFSHQQPSGQFNHPPGGVYSNTHPQSYPPGIYPHQNPEISSHGSLQPAQSIMQAMNGTMLQQNNFSLEEGNNGSKAAPNGSQTGRADILQQLHKPPDINRSELREQLLILASQLSILMDPSTIRGSGT
jgi:hypothetical protein